MKTILGIIFVFAISAGYGQHLSVSFWKKDNHLDSSWTPQWSNLKAYWKMDGVTGAIASGATVRDYFGTSNGTTNGAGLSYVAGKISQGISFDNSHYINVPRTSPANVCTAMTAVMWVKWSAPTSPTYGSLFRSWNNCASDAAWGLEQNDNTKKISVSVNTTAAFNQALFSNGAPLDGSWHHLALSISAAGAGILYIDGVQDSTATFSMGAGICSPTVALAIGGTACASPMGSGGVLDEFAIWSSVLTPSEILTIYNRQKNGN